VKVVLPDGAELELPDGATGRDVAAAIGPGLAKAALAIRADGELRDLSAPVPDGAEIAILTDGAPDALELIRHDAAHVMATAVMELYPGTKISIGPPIDSGFYYDFEFPEDVKVTDADLTRIYGTAFFSNKDLERHLAALEEARARDHRRLGPQLGLFLLRPESPGMPFFLPNGMVVVNEIERAVRAQLDKRGYDEIKTPQ